MQLTLRTDYGLRTLLYLSQAGQEPVSAAAIADAYGVSRTHLLKVVQALSAAGFVETRPGRSGGALLAREPEAIVIGEVVRALEPNFALVECFAPDGGNCVITPACGLAPALEEARQAFLKVLDAYTLADCLRRPEQLRRLLGIRASS
jgi:Rrf2 family nitric oxide-sensitive transcriptional repressor